MSHMHCNMLAWGLPMGPEWLVIGMLGLLIFGKRLPDVAKGIGGAIKNFKDGLKDTQHEIDVAVEQPSVPAERLLTDQTNVESAPMAKFDPYTGKPLEQAVTTA